jgi:hypothetical protein
LYGTLSDNKEWMSGGILYKDGGEIRHYLIPKITTFRVIRAFHGDSRYRTYARSNPRPLLDRIKSEFSVVDVPTGQLIASLPRILSFKKTRVFLHACLPSVDQKYQQDFHAGVEVWSYFPHAKGLSSSLTFRQFCAFQQRLELPACAHQTWDPTLFLSFHGTTKEAALQILRFGPNLYLSEWGSYGQGFYVSPNVNVAVRYGNAKADKSERAVVMFLSYKGLNHAKMENFGDLSEEVQDHLKSSSESYWVPEEEYLVVKKPHVLFPLAVFVF